jgi:methyl-accepting chemotaxis protein
MHWLLRIRKKFYAIIAFILFSFVAGLAMGQISFSRVQVGGSLYSGIQVKRDAMSALAAMKADIAILRGDLYSAALSSDVAPAGKISKLTSAIKADLRKIGDLQISSSDKISCGSCHSPDIIDVVFSPAKSAAEQWRTLHDYLQTAVFPSVESGNAKQVAPLLQGEVALKFAEIIEQLAISEEILSESFQPQISYIIGEADVIRKGFLAGGLAMTVFFLIGAMTLLKHTTKQISRENEELLSAAKDLEKVSMEQASKIDFIAAATSEVSQAIGEVANLSSNALEASQDAAEVAAYGKETSGYTLGSIKKGAGLIREAAETIESLDKRSRGIASIVSTINTIAMQTNLLALNAAVEAARAGEHGRGFSVVAGEVQNLAARTKQATGEIEEMIQFVLSETSKSMESITKSRDEAEKSVKFVDAVSQSFDSIVTAADKTSGMVGQIAEFTSKQSTTTAEISDSIRKIADIHQEAEEAANRLRGCATA